MAAPHWDRVEVGDSCHPLSSNPATTVPGWPHTLGSLARTLEG